MRRLSIFPFFTESIKGRLDQRCWHHTQRAREWLHGRLTYRVWRYLTHGFYMRVALTELQRQKAP